MVGGARLGLPNTQALKRLWTSEWSCVGSNAAPQNAHPPEDAAAGKRRPE
jgi:hypothetical protein